MLLIAFILILFRGVYSLTGNSTEVCSLKNNANGSCRPTLVEFFASTKSPDSEKIIILTFAKNQRYAVCYPENENLQSYLITNQVNLMSHVFCRQMGYMTYTSRHPTNMIEENEKAFWPTGLCNGTEQRLEDCYWPEAKLVNCKQLLEVKCGTCSRYFSHVDDGVITTPGFPNSFPYTIQCDWLIYTKLGEGIELRFTAFNLPTQLPFTQIGSSSCVTSNAYLEITPNDDEVRSIEDKVVSNSNRYCVYKTPDRKMRIKAKAVWLHFSSGIHSALFWSHRSHPFIKKPIGIKIYFRALPATSEPQTMNRYLITGLTILSSIVVILAILVIVWIKSRFKSPTKNQLHRISQERKRINWKRLICCRRKDSIKIDQTNNYEEIQQRPAVPPRTFPPKFSGVVPRQLLTQSQTESNSQRSVSTMFRLESQVQSKLTDEGSREGLSPSPTSSATRQYMQIVCSSSGHCQYIPCDEIQCHRQTTRNIESIKTEPIYKRTESQV